MQALERERAAAESSLREEAFPRPERLQAAGRFLLRVKGNAAGAMATVRRGEAFCCAFLCMAASAMPAWAARTVYTSPKLDEGLNVISLPALPVDADPPIIFSGLPLEGRLSRWDAALQVEKPWGPDFGSLHLGDACSLVRHAGDASVISYEGVLELNDDFFLGLPEAGTTYIGPPYSHSINWADVKVTDGAEVLNMQQAVALGWLAGSFRWDARKQEWITLGLPEEEATKTSRLDPWGGYRITSWKPDLALILPGGDPDQFGSISGRIMLQNYSGDYTKVPISVELRRPGETTAVLKSRLYLDADGNFRLPDVKPGTYDVCLKGTHFLAKLIRDVVVPEPAQGQQ